MEEHYCYKIKTRINSVTYYLVTVWEALNKLKNHLWKSDWLKLAISILGSGHDELDWKSMVEVFFKHTGVDI